MTREEKMNIKFDKIQPKRKRIMDLKDGDAFEFGNDIYIKVGYSSPDYRRVFNLTRNILECFEGHEFVHPVTINATVEYERAD